MKKITGWIAVGFFLLVSFSLTFMRSPEELTIALQNVSKDVQSYSLLMHIVFILVVASGLFIKKIRNIIFSLFIALLSSFCSNYFS